MSKLLSDVMPELRREWDVERNSEQGLNFDTVLSGSNKKVWWNCVKGHKWEATVNSRCGQRTGCPYCSGRRSIKGETDLATVAPELLKEWDYEKNESVTPEDLTLFSNKKVWWRCELCHSWSTSVGNRVQGKGCPYCAGQFILAGYNDFKTWCCDNKREDLLAEWDYNKNVVQPSEVSPHNSKKVWWKCSKGHEWEAQLGSRTGNRPSGCPYCSNPPRGLCLMRRDGNEKLNNTLIPSSDDVLAYLDESGIINLDNVLKEARVMNLEKIIKSRHKYQVWQGVNGRWNCYVPDHTRKNGRRLVSSGSKEKLLDKLIKFIPDDAGQINSNITLRELYVEWLEYKKLTVAETTIPRIQLDWRKHYECSYIIDIPISRLNKAELEIWLLTKLHENEMTKTDYYNVSSIMRQMFEFALDKEYIQDNPMSRVTKKLKKLFKKVEKQAGETQVYTNEEVQMLRELILEKMKTPGRRVYELAPLAILFQLYTGMRVGEICVLRYSDVSLSGDLDISRMLVRDFGTIRDSTKGGGCRKIHLTPTALEIIEMTVKYKKGDNSGFIFSTTNEPLKERVINDYLARYCKELGILYRSSHKLRKTACSSMVNSGMSIEAVRQYVGHESEQTTLRHYVYDNEGEKARNEQVDKALSYN